MGKVSKATKKFQSKHLKHTLDHRREAQKHAKKYGKKGPKVDKEPEPKVSKASKEVFNDMSVEDFFAGGFEVPKEKKTKQSSDSSESGDSDGEEKDLSDEDGSGSSDEEDEEALKQDLEKLKDKDPEFYKYLQNNDKDLLDFEGVNPLDAMSEDEEEEAEEVDTKEAKVKPQATKKVDLTLDVVRRWKNNLETPSAKMIRNISIAFKAAVNINSSAEEDYKYSVTDPKAFNELMFLALQDVPQAIQKIAPYKIARNGARTVNTKNQNATLISQILKSQAGCYITLLKDITNTETAALVLTSIQEVLPFYLSYRRLLKRMLAAVIEVWATTPDTNTQLATFAFLKGASEEFPKAVLESVLRTSYSSFLQNCRKTNVHTLPLINICKNSAAQLYGIDEQLSYQVGFEFVRQIAVHLRNSISATSNAKEGYKTIYNWQFCHSLDFWSRVVAERCAVEDGAESPLRSLIYPLVQVTLGTIKLIPTAQFFPLRFYLIRSLIRLSQHTGVFIPIFPLIAEILTSTAITKPPKRATLPALDFDLHIRASQQYLGTRVYQEGLCEQFVELSFEFFVLYCKSIAFPELVTPAVLSLRRFIKKSKNLRFNKSLQQLIEKLNANAKFITQQRANVEYGPSNKTEVQLFLKDFEWEKTPLGQYVVVQRKTKDEKARLIREAIEEEERNAAAKKEDSDDEVDDAIDQVMESSDEE